MKIVNWPEFAALPPGTIFSAYEEAICRGLYRKEDTILIDGTPRDFVFASLVPNCWNGDAPTVDITDTARWAEFNYDQRFVVFEPADVAMLKRMLESAS